MNRRERQLIERKQEILTAALKLFEAKGYLETSMEEIAEAADVARATLYNHFPSKAEVVLALTASVAEGWLKQAAAKLEHGGSPGAAITALLVATAEWFDAHPDSATTFYHAMREIMAKQTHKSPPPMLVPNEWVVAAQDNGELTKDLPPNLLVLIIESVLRSAMMEFLQGTGKAKLSPTVKRQAEIVMQRLRP